jgi:catechol-2,3-dioxygenase
MNSAVGHADAAPRVQFSHMGLACTDLAAMVGFYERVLGLVVTDRGVNHNLDIVFMSRSPAEHHQIVLTSGKPATLPPNTRNPIFGPVINQISFRLESLADLKRMHRRVLAEKPAKLMIGNHGISWSVYFSDPEGNMIECFVDTDWYITLPFMEPLDLAKSDAEIQVHTEALCRARPGFRPMAEWRRSMSTAIAARGGAAAAT